MATKDELNTAIYDLLSHGIQFDLDCTMSLMIAQKPVLARERVKSMKDKLKALDTLLETLQNESKTKIKFKPSKTGVS